MIEFENECKKYDTALEEGKIKYANRAVHYIHKNYLILKEQDRLHELIPLLENDSLHVRIWTARYLLNVATAQAERTLKQLENVRRPGIGLSATVTLSEWKNGNLTF
ncbi:hypothetical protein [Neobacillus sp. YIM B06451]|uniref:hypothetical protein n=1 Tax=Neobacillus sp. YIM B06451 TaxID=3070994 RepID=UPI00293085FA|nr:hypothetical protein [Neobacillus sp. YIM B06451]